MAEKPDLNYVYDLHKETLKVLGSELERLHGDIADGVGDDDQSYHNIELIVSQLNSLSLTLADIEATREKNSSNQ